MAESRLVRTAADLVVPSFQSGRVGLAILLLRLFVGTAFLFHGSGKTGHLESFAQEFGVPVMLAAVAAYGQLIGAILLIVGLFTPLGAVLIAGTMAVATAKLVERGEPFVSAGGHSWEASSFYLAVTVALLLLGPGRYSVDRLLFSRRAAHWTTLDAGQHAAPLE